jgi:hypothetical protein
MNKIIKANISWFGAILFALFFLITDIHIARNRLFWYDEIGTLQLIKLSDIATLWRVQNTLHADSLPTAYVLLVRLVSNLAHSEIGVRFVSALAMAAALLIVFDCARRLTDGLHGMLALSILAGSLLADYGYEGRSYALVVLFTAAALWLWLHTKPDSQAAAVAFGAAILLDVSMHFYAVLAMVPFGVWELYYWRPGRMPSRKFVAGVVGLLCALALCAQQMIVMHGVGLSAAAWSKPSVSALIDVFSEFFRYGPFLLAILAMLACFPGSAAKPMDDSERLCWLFLTIPFAGYVVAEVATHSFYNRYLITILPGIAVGFACMVSRQLTKLLSMAFLLFVMGVAAKQQIWRTRYPGQIEPNAPSSNRVWDVADGGQQAFTRQALKVEDAIVGDGKSTIITATVLVQDVGYYSKRPSLYVMYGPDVDHYYCEYLGDRCWSLELAKSHAKELAALYPTTRFLAEMYQAGFQATVKMTTPMVVYFSPR